MGSPPTGAPNRGGVVSNVVGVVCVILHLAVLVQYWRMTDGHSMSAYTVL